MSSNSRKVNAFFVVIYVKNAKFNFSFLLGFVLERVYSCLFGSSFIRTYSCYQKIYACHLRGVLYGSNQSCYHSSSFVIANRKSPSTLTTDLVPCQIPKHNNYIN